MRDGVNPIRIFDTDAAGSRLTKRKRRTHPDKVQHGRPPFRRAHVSVVPHTARVEHGDEGKAEAQCALGTEFARWDSWNCPAVRTQRAVMEGASRKDKTWSW